MKQVSVFVENRPGRLKLLLAALDRMEVNIRALSIADTADFGIVRMILSDTEKGIEAVKGAGFAASTNEVLAVDIPDQPGGLLHTVAEPLSTAGVNIEYVYAFVDSPLDKARAVLKVGDIDAAEKLIGK
ncbi:MAG TPA: amino acid-binding protein [Chloroflexota bacterium]|nr:amino acid-binding protein [Chloroflexota bacterium]